MIFLFYFLVSVESEAQINVCGTVVENRQAKEPLAGASVVIKDANGKIKKFERTKSNGSFSMQIASTNGLKLEVKMMGFAPQSFSLDSISFPYLIRMEEGQTLLKEVTVKADRIREQGDTITYYTGSFAQQQDRSIGDVLKRMPGINVDERGKIQYQGEDINKFYIEGSDLLNGKYGVATNGISHNDVGAVEILENHQPMQVLSGISFSPKAAINLKLKDKAKATWNLHGNTAGGWSCQPDGIAWDSELFAMAVKTGYQSIITFKTNNTGEDISSSSTDYLAEKRGTGLNQYVNVKQPEVPILNKRRTIFNRSYLVSTNNLVKIGCGELKTNIDYAFNRFATNASNITTYFLDKGNRVIMDSHDGVEHNHSLNGKIMYELNQRTTFVNNTLQANLDWSDIRLRTSGTMSSSQHADLPDYYISNRLKVIKRFLGKHIVTFESRNELESLPQTLKLNTNENMYRQQVNDFAFHTHESAAYLLSVKGISIGLEGGVKGYWRTMSSQLSRLPEMLSGMTYNSVHTNSFAIYATPKIEYWMKRVNFTMNLPFSLVHYDFNKCLSNQSKAYFSLSLNVNWKPNNRFSGSIHGGIDCHAMDLRLIHNGMIMTDFRTFVSGTDRFYNTYSRNLSAKFSYKQVQGGLFANGYIMHSWNHSPYTLAQQLHGDYVVYSYPCMDNEGKTLMAMTRLGKTLNFWRGSCDISASFNRTTACLLSQQQLVKSIGSSWNTNGKLNGSPTPWFSFDYSIDYSKNCITMNDASAPWLSTLTNELCLSFTLHPKCKWQIMSEYYRNELTENVYKDIFMFDTNLTFNPNNRVELKASLTNILNNNHYSYITYSQLSSYESQRLIRGRQLLISITFRK